MYQTKGIVLRKYDIGNDDRGYIVYTKDYGKKQLFVKSARKIKSKLSGHFAEFAEIGINFIRGKNCEKITGAQMDNSFLNLRNDLRKIVLGNFVLDIVDNFIKWDHPDKEIYFLIKEIFSIIDQQEDIKKCYFSVHIFVWKLLILSGYKPELNKCAFCGNNTLENVWIDESGSAACEKCFKTPPSDLAGRLNPPRQPSRTPPKAMPTERGQALVRGEVHMIHKSALDYLKGRTERVEKSEEIISVIQKFMRMHLDKVLKSEIWVDKLFNFRF